MIPYPSFEIMSYIVDLNEVMGVMIGVIFTLFPKQP